MLRKKVLLSLVLTSSFLLTPIHILAESSVTVGSVVQLPTNVAVKSGYKSESEIEREYAEDCNSLTSSSTDFDSRETQLINSFFPGSINKDSLPESNTSSTTLSESEFLELIGKYKDIVESTYIKNKEDSKNSADVANKKDALAILEAAKKAMNGVDPITGKVYETPITNSLYDQIIALCKKYGATPEDIYNQYMDMIENPDKYNTQNIQSAMDITFNSFAHNLMNQYFSSRNQLKMDTINESMQNIHSIYHLELTEDAVKNDYFDKSGYVNKNNNITDIKYICGICGGKYSFDTNCDCGKILYCPNYYKKETTLFTQDYSNQLFTHFKEDGSADGYNQALTNIIPLQAYRCEWCGEKMTMDTMSDYYISTTGHISCLSCVKEEHTSPVDPISGKPYDISGYEYLFESSGFEPLFKTYGVAGISDLDIILDDYKDSSDILNKYLEGIEDEKAKAEMEAMIKLYKAYEASDGSAESIINILNIYMNSIDYSDTSYSEDVQKNLEEQEKDTIQKQIKIYTALMNGDITDSEMLGLLTIFNENNNNQYDETIAVMSLYLENGKNINSAIDAMVTSYKKQLEKMESIPENWGLIDYKTIDLENFVKDTFNVETSINELIDISFKCETCGKNYGYGKHCDCGKICYNKYLGNENIVFNEQGYANNVSCTQCQQSMSVSNINIFYALPTTKGWYICKSCLNSSGGKDAFENGDEIAPILDLKVISGIYEDAYRNNLELVYGSLANIDGVINNIAGDNLGNAISSSQMLAEAKDIYDKIKTIASNSNELPEEFNGEPWDEEMKAAYKSAIEEVFNKGIPGEEYWPDDIEKIADTPAYEEAKNKIFAKWPADKNLWTDEQKKFYEEFCSKYSNNTTLQDMQDKGIFNSESSDIILGKISEYIAGFTSIEDKVTVTCTIDTGYVENSNIKKTYDVQGTMDISVTNEAGIVVKSPITVNYNTDIWWIPDAVGKYSVNRNVRYYTVSWDIVSKKSIIRLEAKYPDGTTELLTQTEIIRIAEDKSGLTSSNCTTVSLPPTYVNVISGNLKMDVQDFYDTERYY